jgi:hypothetical protein
MEVMRMRTIVIFQDVYAYNELDEHAKYKVKSIFDYCAFDDAMSSLNKFCDVFDIKITDYSIDMSGGKCAYSYIKWNFKTCEIESLQFNELYEYLYINYSNIINDECSFTGYFLDYSLMFNLVEFLKTPHNTNGIMLFESCIELFLNDLLSDIEYYYTDEAMTEMCNANDYEFTKDGILI